MKSWYSASELAGLPGLPRTVQNINEKAKRESWTHRPRQGRGGGREYSIYSLPAETREFLSDPSRIAARRCALARWRCAFGRWLVRLGNALLREEG